MLLKLTLYLFLVSLTDKKCGQTLILISEEKVWLRDASMAVILSQGGVASWCALLSFQRILVRCRMP